MRQHEGSLRWCMVWGREAVVKGGSGIVTVRKHLHRIVPEVGLGEGREVRIIMGVEVMRRAWGVIGS